MSDPDMGNCGDLMVLSPNSSFPWHSASCWNYEYNADGNPIRRMDHKGQTIWFQCDPSTVYGRKTMESKKLWGTGMWSTPAKRRMTQTDKTVDGTPYTTHTTYDTIGRVASVGYPDGTTVNYAYNGPLLQRIYEGATSYVQYAGYNALGQPATATFGNGVVTHYTYSNSGNGNCPEHNFRLCTLITALDANTYQNLRYSYDNAGNMTSITNPINGNESFVPDDLDRLTSATGPYGTINYTYDQIGNMTTNSQVGSYTYPASGTGSVRPHAVSQAGGNTYTYDANGNMISGAGRTLGYDTENRPTSITSGGTTAALVYDGDGGRVKKTVAGTTTIYIGKLYECTGGVCTKHIFAGSQQIAQKTTTGTIHYYHIDHLGSSNVVTDSNGNQVQSLTYYPYGSTRTNSGSVDVHYKYTGQELDNETGLYFYNARYYDPVLGRFISADTIVPNPRNPQDLNRYSYVNNNPLNAIDPTGHSWLSEFLHDTEEFFREDIGGMLITQTFMPALGTCYLSQSEAGRNILAAEIGIGTAVATWGCGFCGVGIGATMGEAFGAYGAGRNGGDYLTGVSIGGLSGALGGAAGGWAGGLHTFTGAVTAGGVGGFTQGFGYTLAYGGSLQEAWTAGYQGAIIGATIGAVAWGLNEAFREYSSYGYDPETDQYIRIEQKDASIFPKYRNVFGSDPIGHPSWCNAGSACSNFFNNLPWGNSGGHVHDGIVNYLMGVKGYTYTMSNYPTMIHGGILTIGASFHEFPSAPLTVDQVN